MENGKLDSNLDDKSFVLPDPSPVELEASKDSVCDIKIDSVTGGCESPVSPVESGLKIKRIVDLQEQEVPPDCTTPAGYNHWTTIEEKESDTGGKSIGKIVHIFYFEHYSYSNVTLLCLATCSPIQKFSIPLNFDDLRIQLQFDLHK